MSTQNPNRGGGKRPSRSAKANTSGRQSSEGKGKKQFSKSFDNKGERNFRPKRRDGEQSGEYRPKQFSKSFDNKGEGNFRPKRRDGEQSGEYRPKQFSKSFDNKGERNFRPKRRDGEQSGEYRPKQFSKSFDNKGERNFRPKRRDGEQSGEYRPKQFSKSFDNKGERNFRPKRRDGEQSGEYRPKQFSSKFQTKTSRTFGKGKKGASSETPRYNLGKFEKNHRRAKQENEPLRLNKFIAHAGVCSRREADELIQKGRVTVNGVVITEMGHKVLPTDKVVFEGRQLKPEKFVYVLLNKPKDYITTTQDPDARNTVMELVHNACEERIYPVGRLDRNTTGLLLFTNDGELAEKLAHPSNQIRKVYEVTLDKPMVAVDFDRLLAGIQLEDGPVTVDAAAIISPDNCMMGIEIHSGRNRIVRRIFEHLGYEVVKLDRTMFANLTKKNLKRAQWRYLTEKEVINLKYFL